MRQVALSTQFWSTTRSQTDAGLAERALTTAFVRPGARTAPRPRRASRSRPRLRSGSGSGSGSGTDDTEPAEYVAYANQDLAQRGPLPAPTKTILNDAASGGSFPAAKAATDAAEADALTAGIVAVQHVVAP